MPEISTLLNLALSTLLSITKARFLRPVRWFCIMISIYGMVDLQLV